MRGLQVGSHMGCHVLHGFAAKLVVFFFFFWGGAVMMGAACSFLKLKKGHINNPQR